MIDEITSTTFVNPLFISKWKTTSANEVITLPLNVSGTYNFTVDWGDGSPLETHTTDTVTHTYVTPGEYVVKIDGTMTHWGFFGTGDKDKIIEVLSFGDMGWTNLIGAFQGCTQLTSFAGGDVSGVTAMSYFFDGATALVSVDLSSWDTSGVTTFSKFFQNASSLTSVDLSMLDTSAATDLVSMFQGTSFTSLDLSTFNTSSVITMGSMFRNMTALTDLDLTGWDTSAVTNMTNMFDGATAMRDLDLSDLDVSAVTSMNSIFANMSNLDFLDVDTWNISLSGGSTGVFTNTPNVMVNCDQGGPPGSGLFFTLNCKSSFISTWRTTAANETITLPLRAGFSYNFLVDWGDGSPVDHITSDADPLKTHSYSIPGDYQVIITGQLDSWYFNNAGDKDKLRLVTDFGDVGWLDLDRAFAGCTNLISFAGGDTANVSTMQAMFSGASSLTSLDVTSFDTSAVTNMRAMFAGLTSLTTLDLTGTSFTTSSVTTMAEMFAASSALLSLDFSLFDTSNVSDMSYMFSGAAALTNLDLSFFDVSAVTNMNGMFQGMNSLISLNVSAWNVGAVTSMREMFRDVTSLATLNLSSFNTTNVGNFMGMFWGMSSLNSLDITNFNTGAALTMESMFQDLSSLPNLDIGHFSTGSVVNMSNMFRGMSSITSLDLSSANINTSSVTNMAGMFAGMTSLTSLRTDGTNWNTSGVMDMSEMFRDCSSLVHLDLRHFNVNAVTDMGDIFSGTTGLQYLNVMGWDITSSAASLNVFNGTNAGIEVICDQGVPLSIATGTFFGQSCTNGCPPEYIRVAGDPVNNVPHDFCVMKYEARNQGGIATSQAAGMPWTNLGLASSASECTALGTGFDLIGNQEWLTLSQDIEQVNQNWSGASVGNGHLSTGWSLIGNTGLAPTTSTECLFNTSADSCNLTGAHADKRTHLTSYNEEVWDLAGNAEEYVDWDHTSGGVQYGPNDCNNSVVELNAVGICSIAANEFQTIAGTYTSTQRVGKFRGGTSGVPLRGGAYNQALRAGLFALDLSQGAAAHPQRGFRCVFRPPPPF